MAGGGALRSSPRRATGSGHVLARTPGGSRSASSGSSSCSSRTASRHTSTSGSCKFTVPPPTGVAWVLTLLAFAGTYGATLLLLVTSLFSRRRPVLIDVLVRGRARARSSPALLRARLRRHRGRRLLVDVRRGGRRDPGPLARRSPSPWRSRHARTSRGRSSGCATSRFTLGAVCLVIDGKGLLLSVLASVLIGWGAAAAVRLVTGTPSGLPGAQMVAAMVAELGIETRIRLAHGRAELGRGALRRGGAPTARPLRVSVYGRDARDAELASTVGRADRLPRRGHGAVRHAPAAGRARGLRDAARPRRARTARRPRCWRPVARARRATASS